MPAKMPLVISTVNQSALFIESEKDKTMTVSSPFHLTTAVSRSKGQSLAEYLLIALLLGGMGLAGIVGFNGGFSSIMQLLGMSLAQGAGGGGAKASISQTNSAIAAAHLSKMGPSSLPVMVDDTESTVSALPSAFNEEQLLSLNALLSSISPTELPEVTGANSHTDVTKLVDSAHLLIQQAKVLDSLADKDTGLDVGLLSAQAKQYAIALYVVAILLDTETNQTACDAATVNGVCNIDTPLMQEAGDYLDTYSSEWDNEASAKLLLKNPSFGEFLDVVSERFQTDILSPVGNDKVIVKTNELLGNFKLTYQPIASTINQLNLQTQQAKTVKTNGGNINSQSPAAKNIASKTAQDANAISACQNATCTP
jgi:hypothetical protein